MTFPPYSGKSRTSDLPNAATVWRLLRYVQYSLHKQNRSQKLVFGWELVNPATVKSTCFDLESLFHYCGSPIFYWSRLHTSCWVHNSFHVIKIYLVQLTQGQPQRSLEKVKFWGGISMHKLATDDFKYNLARHKKTSRWNLHWCCQVCACAILCRLL